MDVDNKWGDVMPGSNRRKINTSGPVRLTTIAFLNLLMLAGLMGLTPPAMAAESAGSSENSAGSPRSAAIRFPDLAADAPGKPPTIAPPTGNKQPAPQLADLAGIDANKSRPVIS